MDEVVLLHCSCRLLRLQLLRLISFVTAAAAAVDGVATAAAAAVDGVATAAAAAMDGGC